MSTTNSASAIEQLRQRVNGEVLLPGDESYAVARQTKALVQDRFPSIIVRPTSAEDVSEAVKFAVANGLPLAVRGGGHSIAGHSTISGSLNIDLSTMRGVTIDVEKQTARVQGGAHSRDLAIPAAEVGLALTTGDTGSVGVGGLVTGGGIGYFVRKYGLAADRVLSATVVTANGDILTASATENPDLFWAVRGGGGNFGVVVDYEFQLFPVPAVYGGALILPATPETVRGYLDYAPNAPENLSTIGNIVHMPPLPFVPEERHGERVLLILAVFDGDEAEGAKAMAPLRALAEPVADTVGMIPYPAMFDYMEWAEVNHQAEIRMMFTDEIPDATIDDMLAAIDNATSPFACVHLRGLGGALANIPADNNAFQHRNRKYFAAILGVWMDPADDPQVHINWTQDIWNKISHLRQGVYVNFLSDEGEARVREAYPAEVYIRLAEVKAKYDPNNVFRFNQNVRPAAEMLKAAA